jgi:hypothetical protein
VALAEGANVIAVFGPPGHGKSVLLRSLMATPPAGFWSKAVPTAVLCVPEGARTPPWAHPTPAARLARLLYTQNLRGATPLLLLDDVHGIDPSRLEGLLATFVRSRVEVRLLVAGRRGESTEALCAALPDETHFLALADRWDRDDARLCVADLARARQLDADAVLASIDVERTLASRRGHPRSVHDVLKNRVNAWAAQPGAPAETAAPPTRTEPPRREAAVQRECPPTAPNPAPAAAATMAPTREPARITTPTRAVPEPSARVATPPTRTVPEPSARVTTPPTRAVPERSADGTTATALRIRPPRPRAARPRIRRPPGLRLRERRNAFVARGRRTSAAMAASIVRCFGAIAVCARRTHSALLGMVSAGLHAGAARRVAARMRGRTAADRVGASVPRARKQLGAATRWPFVQLGRAGRAMRLGLRRAAHAAREGMAGARAALFARVRRASLHAAERGGALFGAARRTATHAARAARRSFARPPQSRGRRRPSCSPLSGETPSSPSKRSRHRRACACWPA